MLFDEKDLRVFDDVDSRTYFREILQSYYSQNYRAAIVLLYSFVIYDLYMKLQTMANEGNKAADQKLSSINKMIADDEKYSTVESEIIKFFNDNCQLYFNKFIEDIVYLKKIRNKCAHLKVNDNTLYVPSDYQARMLICSMYDHILSVKAPFISDLFTIAKTDVEKYTESIYCISEDGFDESINIFIKNKYLNRMTYDSLKKSYRTFIKLLFVSDNEDAIQNTYGLYAFAYVMTDYIIKNGHTAIFTEEIVLNEFSKIAVDSLNIHADRRQALIKIAVDFPVVMDIIKKNEEVFKYLRDQVLNKPQGLKYFKLFYSCEKETVYSFFKRSSAVQQASFIKTLYNSVNECEDFNLAEFTLIMVKAIPQYYGFDSADSFMSFFIDHLQELTVDGIKSVMEVYQKNNQCTNRGRHSKDIAVISEYLSEHTDSDQLKVEEDKEGNEIDLNK